MCGQARPAAPTLAQAASWRGRHHGRDRRPCVTDGDEDDAAQVPALLRQPEGAIASLTADGAYDRDPVYQAAAAVQPGLPIEVIIPPRADAVLSTADPDGQTPRDRHVQLVEPRGSPDMAERGRIGWQRATEYGMRNQAEMVCMQTTNSA